MQARASAAGTTASSLVLDATQPTIFVTASAGVTDTSGPMRSGHSPSIPQSLCLYNTYGHGLTVEWFTDVWIATCTQYYNTTPGVAT
ncbi:hypothetical protein BAUCODRAFT_31271 [Baudoinia panamericana UAMH 10762]|uniref:Uncharacterized protein n=1 Tax=Baudoinia panamericana (strain UAMH 10762) TaxID=717646 RepID=M2NIU1_BAUPA|nr:uncharacterized protein BAUCODRAFT_31271 [Baudoinia panamericana UAMH 10762]EMC99000.1 hypothetical protein BAUCODRAFT_31271 [Baudoinia panamericana UAMH 10762]